MPDPRFDKIKSLTIVAMVSDDYLMDRLVLKGGNALRLISSRPVRQSLDLDFSIDGDLGPLEIAHQRFTKVLTETFLPEGYTVFDVQLREAPPNITQDTIGDFWGGYTLSFKVMQSQRYNELSSRPQKRPLQAMELGPSGTRAFTVDISKYEWCRGKVQRDIDGFQVYVYSEIMIACEKVRAICQQMPIYREVVKSSSRRPRARDFFDIHYLVTTCGVDLCSPEAWEAITQSFRAKRVPLMLLGNISDEREFHRDNFLSVKQTVDASVLMHEFDYYVDFLVNQLKPLQSRWEMDSPVG